MSDPSRGQHATTAGSDTRQESATVTDPMTPERLDAIEQRANQWASPLAVTCPSCGSAPGARCYAACRECCTSGADIRYQTEDCAYGHDHRDTYCPTVAALDGEQ